MIIVGSYIEAKIFEPRRFSADTMPIEDGDKHGFAIRTSGIDRFGKRKVKIIETKGFAPFLFFDGGFR